MIVLGIGIRESAAQSSFENALGKLPHRQLDAITIWEAKAEFRILEEIRKMMQVPIIPLSLNDIKHICTPTQSERIIRKFGVGSLCEALALAGCESGKLIGERAISDDRKISLAMAECEEA